jgi:hypothetical protein
MPRKLRTRRSRALYTTDHKDQLRTGHDFFDCGFGNGANFREDEAAEAWEVLREEILREHITEAPCTRPWAWWAFEPREPRLCIDAVRDEPEADEDAEEDASLFFGVRSPYWGTNREELRFESQAHYLRRYGLLTKAERAHLERHPELLEPVTGWDAGKA